MNHIYINDYWYLGLGLDMDMDTQAESIRRRLTKAVVSGDKLDYVVGTDEPTNTEKLVAMMNRRASAKGTGLKFIARQDC